MIFQKLHASQNFRNHSIASEVLYTKGHYPNNTKERVPASVTQVLILGCSTFNLSIKIQP